jgi:hypothetical protein
MIKAFADEHNLPFKVSSVLEIIKLNYEVLRRYAAENEKTAPKATSLQNKKQELQTSTFS